MPWELSVIYSPLRLIILMVIAILGMAGWLFYAHQLIEKKTAKSQRVYRYIYNSTTLVTLSLITLINYVILYLLLIISITLFVPVELFNSWTSAQSQFTFSNYMRLIWFVSSLGLLAGAMGSTVENEEKIRRITYSYRQYHRYKEAEQEQKNKKLLVMYHNKMSNNKLQVKMKIMNNMKVKNKDIERRMTHDKSKTVGLVVAPGVTERLAENLIQEMPKMLSTHYDHQQEWIFDLVTDPLTGFAESVDEIFGKVADYHDKRQWDYVIAITDLPMFADKQVMALDINMENGAAIFSYPAFGWRPVKNVSSMRFIILFKN